MTVSRRTFLQVGAAAALGVALGPELSSLAPAACSSELLEAMTKAIDTLGAAPLRRPVYFANPQTIAGLLAQTNEVIGEMEWIPRGGLVGIPVRSTRALEPGQVVRLGG